MKVKFLMLVTAALLASCAPKKEATQTSTDGTTVTTTTTDGSSADSTMNNNDNANVSEEVDMAVGDGLEGTVSTFDQAGKTFVFAEDDKTYNVSVTDTTTYEGAATDGKTFFAEDRSSAKVAVEGEINGDKLVAKKITLY